MESNSKRESGYYWVTMDSEDQNIAVVAVYIESEWYIPAHEESLDENDFNTISDVPLDFHIQEENALLRKQNREMLKMLKSFVHSWDMDCFQELEFDEVRNLIASIEGSEGRKNGK